MSKQKQVPSGSPIRVAELRPGTSGHMVIVKVVNVKAVQQRGRSDIPQQRQMKLAECIVGDDSGVIIFVARNEQVELMQEGTTLVLHNAKIDMFRGSMRLAVDKWAGSIEVSEPATFSVKKDNNLSLIEFESIVVEE